MKYLDRVILLLSIAGLLFAGYLSTYKLFTSSCALNEPCPYFLGLPACYFGFVMYLALALLSGALVFKKLKEKLALNLILFVSVLGILFAGYFTLGELPVFFEKGFSAYVLGLPTCALGLIFYVLIFCLSSYKRIKTNEASEVSD